MEIHFENSVIKIATTYLTGIYHSTFSLCLSL